MIKHLLFLLFFVPIIGWSQKTVVSGIVKDAITGETLPYVKVVFYDSKIGTYTDSVGHYEMETYYATDSLRFIFFGYLTASYKVKIDQTQEINCALEIRTAETEEVVIRPPEELASTRLHKRVVANKKINNKEKLDSYEYELYNKIQLDVNNFGDKFSDRKIVNRLSLVLNYLDSTDNGTQYLPVILGESISDFYFKNRPKKKKEVITATKITGIENLKLDQFVGDMYMDVNVYDNYINIFNKSFISPIANFARTYYKFVLADSSFIDDQWCYLLRYKPKHPGVLTFEGEMWIHDTTYAVKKISGNISEGANINYLQDLYFEQEFEQVANETWMLTNERIIADLQYAKNTELLGIYGRKTSSRKNFVINKERNADFYKSDNTVEFDPDARNRDESYWKDHRHFPLTTQEKGIDQMVDSLNTLPIFVTLKNLTYLATTGYFPLGKVELGNLSSLFSVNPVEKYRLGLALRTSNNFSKRLELGTKFAYGTGDEKLKYSASIRYNITPKKRGMLTTYYNYDIQQIGQSPTAATVGSTFGTLFRTGPLDKLTFVQKVGINLEKDIKKDLILYGGFEWKEFTPLGLANYVRLNTETQLHDTIKNIQTTEFIARIRWTKDEEFIAGTFDRSTLTSKYPIFSLQGIFGIKDLLGGDYGYQKIEIQIDHTRQLGVLGKIRYGVNAGYVFGRAAYPFLKVHEGNQSYWLLTTTFNKLNFFEFVSDKYVGGYIEQHLGGLILDRIPGIQKLKWRWVVSGRITYGSISGRNISEMLLPSFTKQFGTTPYTETGIGLENIFKLVRVDLVWRMTHLDPGLSPLGVRARMTFNF